MRVCVSVSVRVRVSECEVRATEVEGEGERDREREGREGESWKCGDRLKQRICKTMQVCQKFSLKTLQDCGFEAGQKKERKHMHAAKVEGRIFADTYLQVFPDM